METNKDATASDLRALVCVQFIFNNYSQVFTMYMRLLEALSRGKMEISCHLEKDIGNVVSSFKNRMYLNLIKILIHRAACYLIDLQKAIDLTSLILLFLHLLAEALSTTLLNGVRGLKRPATPPVRLAHVITGITTPSEQPVSVLNHKLFSPINIRH